MNKKHFFYIIAGLVLVLVVTIITTSIFTSTEGICYEEKEVDIPAPPPVIRKYGIAIDSFTIEEGRIRRNEVLASLLRRYKLDHTKINQLGIASKDVFDLRKIRAGNSYNAFLLPDSTQQLQYFVYKHTPTEYLLFDFRDSVVVSLGEKPVEKVRKEFSDTVRTSLWMSMVESNTNPLLALELSDIFAWTVNFFMIDQSDIVTVIYDELYVDEQSVGIGKIYGALFTHKNKDIYAIPFTQDSIETYFEPNGASLRREFLKAPLRYRRISSGFTYRRRHPVLGIYRPHTGVDYAAPTGTPVHAVGDGFVVKKGYDRASGNYLRIQHNSVYTTGYCHFIRFGPGITQGSKVRQGQVIGYVGTTGYATGPHLDFRMWKNGSPVNPLTIDAPPADPIKEEYQAAFDSVKVHVIQKIDELRHKLHTANHKNTATNSTIENAE